jgi:hypothetical protein
LPSSSLSHAIYTVALLALLLPILVAFQAYTLFGHLDTLRYELTDITDYVASSTLDLIILARSSQVSELNLTKSLRIPESVDTYGYTLEFQERDGKWYVVAYLDVQRSIEGQTLLPLGENVTISSDRKVLRSGARNPIIWCHRETGEDGVSVTLELGFGIGG